MSTRTIAWQLFVPQYEDKQGTIEHEDIDKEAYSEFMDDSEEYGEEKPSLNLENLLLSRKVKTPFGIFDIDDPFSPYNMFECWIGHTNFKITDLDFKIIDTEISGIGCFTLISPYRFFIGVEKLFTFADIRKQIQQGLCTPEDKLGKIPTNNSTESLFANMESIFSITESEKWAVFVGNDGTIEMIKSAEFTSDIEYQEMLKKMKNLTNGNIIIYDSV